MDATALWADRQDRLWLDPVDRAAAAGARIQQVEGKVDYLLAVLADPKPLPKSQKDARGS